MIERRVGLGLILLAAATACDDPPTQDELPGFDIDAGVQSDAGEVADGDAGGAEPPRTGPQFAVVSSDWSATSISLLDGNGNVLADDYLTSGSKPAGLVTALSGDVELPTRPNDPGVLVVLDRYKTDVITRIQLSDGTILGQVKTHTPPEQDSENAYSSNPHDYVRIDEHTAWVSRFEPNLDPGVPAIDRGTDLLRIDPSTMTRSEERIDLSPLNTVAMRTDPDSGESEEVQIYARPSAIVRLGDVLVVGLSRMAFDFSAVGPGMVALVSLETKQVQGVALEGLSSCSSVMPVPNDDAHVVVSCQGFYADPDPRATAGIALLEVKAGEATITATWLAKDHADAPKLGGAISLGGTKVAATANDYSGASADALVELDLADGSLRVIAENEPGSGSLGSLYFDPRTERLFVPDASVDGAGKPVGGLRRFLRGPAGFDEEAKVIVSAATGMPVRHVSPL